MTPINACRESQKWPHGLHASLNLLFAFHHRKMAAMETPSKNRKRQRFIFDDIESSVLSKEDDNVLVGSRTIDLFKNDVHEGKAKLANAITMHSKINSDILGKRSNCFDEDNEVDMNPVVSSEENLPSVSSTSESSPDLTFVQQTNIL